jgi:hypothetical protein
VRRIFCVSQTGENNKKLTGNARPYMVRRNTVVRCKNGFLRSLEPGTGSMRIRRCGGSLLKIHKTDTAKEKHFVKNDKT